MKTIGEKILGQYIWEQASYFRSDVYLEGISTSTETDMLVVDSNNKISKRAIDAITIDVSDFMTNGSDNRVVTATGADAMNAEANLIFDGSELSITGGLATSSSNNFTGENTFFTSAASLKPWVQIKNTNSNTTSGNIAFIKDKGAAGADGDDIGAIWFQADNSAQELTYFAKILAEISEADDTDEAGKLTFSVAASDGSTSSLTAGLILEGEHATGGEVDVTIGAGSASTTTIAGDLSVTTGLILDSVDVTNIQTSGESFADNDTSLMTSAAAHNEFASRGYFLFQGYGTSDATNYEMAEILSDTNAPFEHNTSRGSDGLTAGEPRAFMKAGAKVMPYAGVLKKWTGWATSAGSGTIGIGLFKVTPTRNSTTNLTPVLLKNHQFTALGNTKLEDVEETSFSVAFAAGDMIYSAVKGATDNKAFFFTTTLEVEWT